MKTAFCVFVALVLSLDVPLHAADYLFSCEPANDLYRVAKDAGLDVARLDTPEEAVEGAEPGSAVLILAHGYPEKQTPLGPDVFQRAVAKRLRLYVEYPSWLPGMELGAPKDVKYERGVVTSDFFGERLGPMRIVLVSSCRYLPAKTPRTHLVAAKVAGVDTAFYGLADTPAEPLLFEPPDGSLLVATTKLSHFVSGRYLPAEAWQTIWESIFAWLNPEGGPVRLSWTPTVHPSYGPREQLPETAERDALRRSADWILAARLLRHQDWPKEVLDLSLTYNTIRPMPAPQWPAGDGSLGILEGFSSTIHPDGRQPARYAVRNDCTGEAAMLLALDSKVNSRGENARRAANLLDYVFQTSVLAAGPRANPDSPSFGLVGWAVDHPDTYWGDDNARALLAIGAVSAATGEERWNESVAKCILGNFRTSGVRGFRPECVQDGDLQRVGWKEYWTSQHVHYSPHMQSWLWACNLWAYEQTGFEPLLSRSKTGMRLMMEAYPGQWNWVLRSGTIERARLLLPLAWLVRVDDTPEHRRWLRRIAEDLVGLQDDCGAFREVMGDGGTVLPSNASYGTSETSLIQTDGDTVCDMLYSCNFALIGLHEAAAATGDPFYAEAEDRLARFLCRIQTRSRTHPELDGAWYRAFDYGRWDYWASSADWEWGPWCMESGWCQPWIAGTLALRAEKTSLWEMLRKVDLKPHFEHWRPAMLPDDVLVSWRPETIEHAARAEPGQLKKPVDSRYPAVGPGALTDGELGSTDYRGGQWLGYEGSDL